MVGYGQDHKNDDLNRASQWIGFDEIDPSMAYADIRRNKITPGPRLERPPTIEESHESASDHAIYRTYPLPMGLVWIYCPILPVVSSRILSRVQSVRLFAPYDSSSTRLGQRKDVSS